MTDYTLFSLRLEIIKQLIMKNMTASTEDLILAAKKIEQFCLSGNTKPEKRKNK